MKNNENNVCASCGKCCLNMPGIVFPEQISNITVDVLVNLFKEGYCFDYWEGNPTSKKAYEDKIAYFLRPQTVRGLGKIVDASWGGACSFLTSTGCKLKFDDRPMECQNLKVNISHPGECGESEEKGYDKKNAAIKWLQYNEIIEEAISKIRSL